MATVRDGQDGEQGPKGDQGPQGPPGDSASASGGSSSVPGDAQPVYRSGTRIKARALVGDDGSHQLTAWYDSEFKVECAWLQASDGVTRCLPVGASAQVSGFFADPGCSSALAETTSGASNGYAAALTDGRYRVFELGSSYTGTLYQPSGSSCSELADIPGHFALLGAEVQPDAFVGATVEDL